MWWCYNNNKIKDGNEDPEKFKDKFWVFNRIWFNWSMKFGYPGFHHIIVNECIDLLIMSRYGIENICVTSVWVSQMPRHIYAWACFKTDKTFPLWHSTWGSSPENHKNLVTNHQHIRNYAHTWHYQGSQDWGFWQEGKLKQHDKNYCEPIKKGWVRQKSSFSIWPEI